MNKTLKKVLNIVVNILMFLVFSILILIIYVKVNMLMSGNNYFEFNGYSFFCVATGSMEPVISQNDIIVVKKEKKYQNDDIITFKKDNSFVTHRIISINDNSVTTKGDANNAIDVAISYDDIIGKVIKIYHNMGVWQKILTTPSVIIMIFITLILFDFAFSFKGFKKKDKILVEVDESDSKKKKTLEKNEKQKNVSEEKILENDLSSEEIDKIVENVKKDDETILEDEDINYTIRLDLSKLQKEIDDKINKEE